MKLKAIITGVGVALTITIMGMLFIATWILLDEGTAYYLPTFGVLLGIISCLAGGIKGAARIPRNWWWQAGALIAAGYLAITYLLVNLIFPTAISWDQLSNWMAIILAAMLGSMLGYFYRRTIAFRYKERARGKL
ncbi:MAG: TIGR04086 family membrane protein [Clostridia bacterium]|nr:TIGR04086 family membrane protein [Clostridia bacterium]